MPTFDPVAWAETTYREAHGGHFHTRKVKSVATSLMEDEHKGILYRVLPSLCEEDEWHAHKGYKGNIKAAQVLIYDKYEGYKATLQYNDLGQDDLPQRQPKRNL